MARATTRSVSIGTLVIGALLAPGVVASAQDTDTSTSVAPTSAPVSTVAATTSSTTTSSTTTSSTTTSTTTNASATTTTSATAATTTGPSSTQPRPTRVPCAPPTTTTTTTTLPDRTTTTTTTTTLPGTTTTSTTTTPPPPCPTTTVAGTTVPPPAAAAPAVAPATAPLGVHIPHDLGQILLTIRTLESGGRYDAPPNKGRASGAYQFIAGTWNNHAGYPHAYLAPPAIQDERALADVRSILWTWKGDVSMVPVMWYYPKAARQPELMDQVPLPQFGNRLTVREYQRRWLQVLTFITGDPSAFRLALAPPGLQFLSGLPPVVERNPLSLERIAFPMLGGAVVAPPQPCADESCAAGSEAIVYGQKLQPVLAAADGVVTAIEYGDPVSGAVTLTLTDIAGRRFHYAGFNDDNQGTVDGDADPSLRFTALGRVGAKVRAGQIIGFLGDTDPMPGDENRGATTPAVWPHLRLTIFDHDGTRLDADMLVVAAQQAQACHVGIGPWSVPPDATTNSMAGARRRADVDVDAILNGGWVLRADGTVTARGRSALILPPEGCEWAPDDSFGPGASGNRPPEEWGADFHVPIRYVVSGAMSSGAFTPVGPLRPG